MYPIKLLKYLKEQADDGAVITQTSSGDAYFWVINHSGLDKWLILVAWYEGSEDYQLINLTGNAYDLLPSLMDV